MIDKISVVGDVMVVDESTKRKVVGSIDLLNQIDILK
jgi:hypothetical protein